MFCPFCKREDAKTTRWSVGIGVHVSCLSCGSYLLTGRLAREPKLLQDKLDQEPQARERAVHAIQSRTSDNNPIVINANNLDDLLKKWKI